MLLLLTEHRQENWRTDKKNGHAQFHGLKPLPGICAGTWMNDPAGCSGRCARPLRTRFSLSRRIGHILAANARAKTQTGRHVRISSPPGPAAAQAAAASAGPEGARRRGSRTSQAPAGPDHDQRRTSSSRERHSVPLGGHSCVLVIASKLADRNAREREPQRRFRARGIPTIVGQERQIRGCAVASALSKAMSPCDQGERNRQGGHCECGARAQRDVVRS